MWLAGESARGSGARRVRTGTSLRFIAEGYRWGLPAGGFTGWGLYQARPYRLGFTGWGFIGASRSDPVLTPIDNAIDKTIDKS